MEHLQKPEFHRRPLTGRRGLGGKDLECSRTAVRIDLLLGCDSAGESVNVKGAASGGARSASGDHFR